MARTFSFTRRRAHARLRAHVFKRDNFTCTKCGRSALKSGMVQLADGTWTDPNEYDGRLVVMLGWADFLTLDHIVPRLRGGSDEPGNLCTLCGPCNSRKGAR